MPQLKAIEKEKREIKAANDPHQLKLPEINQKEESKREKKKMRKKRKKRMNGRRMREQTNGDEQ